MSQLPVLLVGAGALGSSILKGIGIVGNMSPEDIMIVDLNPRDEALAWQARGAQLNPPPENWKQAKTVILAVKPQGWHAVAQILGSNLNPEAVILSVMAGVRADSLKQAFAGHPVGRIMPTTGMATGKGVASLYSDHPTALSAAQAIFAPIAMTVVLADEGQMDMATAVSGSGPAYVYAFVIALEKAGKQMGLSTSHARELARGTLISAARLLDKTGEEPADLIAKVASPGGTTEAALKVLCAPGDGIDELVSAAVKAAQDRARELG